MHTTHEAAFLLSLEPTPNEQHQPQHPAMPQKTNTAQGYHHASRPEKKKHQKNQENKKSEVRC